MKKIFILILLLSVFLIGKAQILDSISLKEFKTLKYKQVKALYQNDEDGLELIKKSHTRKINSYVFLGLSVPFAVTLNPTIIFPLGIASIKLSNNTKWSLYNKLKYYERLKYNLDTAVLKIPKDSNVNFYNYVNYTFDIDLKDFDKLSNQKIMEKYGFNDTSKWIIEYSKGSNISKVVIFCTSVGTLILGASFYATGVKSITHPEGFPYQIAFIMGTPLVVSGIWLGIHGIKMKSPKINIYNNLKQYYTKHAVSSPLAKYIKNRREQYKPKPFLN